ncbi:MAG: hypothetical protein DRO00_08300 [Thermoproteota archaeon]|nr:MAG: hypothetical protein DRO00_08300 [Candidatus Korarchaeota archaeon]
MSLEPYLIEKKEIRPWEEELEPKDPLNKPLVLVAFRKPCPAFVGYPDLQTYGPFKPGDVANIPEVNARILLKQDVVEEVIS